MRLSYAGFKRSSGTFEVFWPKIAFFRFEFFGYREKKLKGILMLGCRRIKWCSFGSSFIELSRSILWFQAHSSWIQTYPCSSVRMGIYVGGVVAPSAVLMWNCPWPTLTGLTTGFWPTLIWWIWFDLGMAQWWRVVSGLFPDGHPAGSPRSPC